MGDILALDIGEKRIGVARANMVAKLPEALPYIDNDSKVADSIKNLIDRYGVSRMVIGLPRNLNGQETKQSEYTKQFVDKAIPKGIQVIWQDETLSSYRAKVITGKTKNVDSEAACVILNDFLEDYHEI
ncbi:MAG: Holliday junction resolvase RuvX [Patescibacteria group bacterium]|jgi:putative Holliday junction resolvase|nr:Holliday junction resolvase RuvX [Patescibacteria group bacterium]